MRVSAIVILGSCLFATVCFKPPTYDEQRLIGIARASVVSEVKRESVPLDGSSSRAQAVFVTIEVGGKVRGCRGDLVPKATSLEAELQSAARSAAAHDPRYRPISSEELKKFLVTVTIVDRLDAIQSVDQLKPEDGLVLKSGTKTGVVLPWEGKDPHIRLDWAYRKAGVAKGASIALYRLVAQRFRG